MNENKRNKRKREKKTSIFGNIKNSFQTIPLGEKNIKGFFL